MTGRVLGTDNARRMLEFALDRDIPAWVPVDSSKVILHLGPGNKKIPGAFEMEWPEYNFDGEENATDAFFNFPSNSCGGIYATHVLEHLQDPRPLLRQCSRVLAPGCPMNIFVPHGQSYMYLQDLDHKTPFVLDTWKNLLANPYYSKGRERLKFHVGLNIAFGVKDENLGILTQLIKLR